MGKKSKNDIPLWARTGHSKPVTRREFLAAGLTPFAASMLMPNWLSLLLPNQALAATCPTVSSDLIPFITLNLAGGAAMGANFVPHDAGGQILSSYNVMGLGRNPPIEREFGNVPFAGRNANNVLISQMLQGMRDAAPTALAKTAFVGVCVRSRDDSDENRFSADGMLAKAGLAGSLLPNLGRVSGSPTGIRQMPAVVAPPSPLVVSNFTSITGSLGYAASLGGSLKPGQKQALARLVSGLSEYQTRKLASMQKGADIKNLVECAGIKNETLMASGTSGVDPRLDAQAGAQLNAIWNINAATGGGSQDLIFATMVYNALKSQCGSVALELGGYDYHDNSRTTGNTRDLEAGRLMGRILESAAALNRPVFLYVTSDGATSSAVSDNADSVWVSDRGTAGVSYMLYFNPAGRPATSGFQVGHFTSQQVADETLVTGGSPEAAAAAVFANYLRINSRLDLFAGIAGRVLETSQLEKVLKFG